MRIGFVGLGAMGRAMARNLAAAGHEVRAWNRSGGSAEGVTMVATAAEAFDADAVLTMLSGDEAIRSIVLEPDLLGDARPGLVHVVSSTISVAFAHELAEAHARAGIGYVSAPVLGRPDVAARGELNVLAAGRPGPLEKVRPLLEAIGGRIWPMGDEPAAANAAKIACNMMITMAIEAMAEAVVLTEANGVGRDGFFELILGTLFGSRSYQVYSANIANGTYQPGFKASLGLKDLRLAREAAADADRSLPMLDVVHKRMREAVCAGFGDQDWSVMARLAIEGSRSTSLAASLEAESAVAGIAPASVVGMWVTADGHIRQELLPNGRYDEARGKRKSAYRGRYEVHGSRILYWDDTGFEADGEFIDGVLHHIGLQFYHEQTWRDLRGSGANPPQPAPMSEAIP